jgi:hypothetical protein
MFAAAAAGSGDAPTAALGPRGAVLIATPQRSGRPGSFALPAVAAVCDARDAAAVSVQIDAVMRLLGRILADRATPAEEKPAGPSMFTKTVDGLEMHVLPIGRLLAQRLQFDLLADVEVCWAATDGRLWISTRSDQLARLHRARMGRLKTLERDAVVSSLLPDESGDVPLVEWALLRGRQTSLFLGRALQYIGRTKSEALRDAWWRDWARDRLRERARFGVALKDSTAVPGGAEVVDVEFDSPAAGLLQPGDVVTAFEGKELDAASPARDMADRYTRRGDDARIVLTVRRDDRTRQVEIAVPREASMDVSDMAPIQAMHRLRVLLQRVEAATIERRGLDPARLDLELRVRWHQPTPPRK